MSMYDKPVPHVSHRKLNITRREVNVVCLATLTYLRWSESSNTFRDNPNCVPKSGRLPLIVDPLVGMTRLTKSLMD
jgi:hypothetical protein